MKRLLILTFLGIGPFVYGQEPAMIFEDTIQDKTWINISGFDYYSSNRFNNAYMDKWIFGGEITSEIKNKSMGKLKTLNAIGLEAENSFTVNIPSVNPFKVERLGLQFHISDNHFASVHVPTDAFRLAMFGNGSSLGDTLDMSFANLRYQHYQKIGIGLFDEKTSSSIRLSYVGGSSIANFRTGNTWLYTPTEVDTIHFQLQAAGMMSSSFSPYWAYQGHGFAFDIDYNIVLESKKGKRQVINVRINNLGAIFWNKDTRLFGVDSTNYYAGFDIQDFINRDTSSDNTFDIIDTLGINEGSGAKGDILPVELAIQKLADHGVNQKLQFICGAKAILNPNYRPYLYAGGYFRAHDAVGISSRLSYGGFGGFKWGLNANFWIKDVAYIGVGTYDMIGLISKSVGYGRGLNFNCNIRF